MGNKLRVLDATRVREVAPFDDAATFAYTVSLLQTAGKGQRYSHAVEVAIVVQGKTIHSLHVDARKAREVGLAMVEAADQFLKENSAR